MASIPMFEVEDQTDEDFFDKLVDEGNDDGVGVSGIKAMELSGGPVAHLHESDEAKAFSKLSLNEPVDGHDNPGAEQENGGDVCGHEPGLGGRYELFGHVDHSPVSSNLFAFDSELSVSNKADMLDKLSVNEAISRFDDAEVKCETSSKADKWNRDGLGEDMLVREANSSAISSDSFSFSNGIMPNERIEESELKSESTKSESSKSVHTGVKEVLWSSFSESAGHGVDGFGSYLDFFTGFSEEATDSIEGESKVTPGSGASKVSLTENSYNFSEYQGNHGSVEQSTVPQDSNNSQYWEDLYPGWKYDPYSGQWYQVDGNDGTVNKQLSAEAITGNATGSFDGTADSYWGSSVSTSSQTYAHHAAQSISETVSHLETVPYQVSEVNNEFPSHIMFDPQYPGWYYDTIAEEWRTLETYQLTVQSAITSNHKKSQNGYASTIPHFLGHDHSMHDNSSLDPGEKNLASLLSNYSHQGSDTWQPDPCHVNSTVTHSGGDQAWENAYGANPYSNSHVDGNNFNNTAVQASYGKSDQVYDNSTVVGCPDKLMLDQSSIQQFNMLGEVQQNGLLEYSNEYHSNQSTDSFSQQFVPNGHQFVPHVERSSAGRPPHALVTFGFGGKLIVMKDQSSLVGTKDSEGPSISVLNLMDIVKEKDIDSSNTSSCNYFRSLCHQSFPGPVVNGSTGNKEVNKWIDERISNCQSPEMDHRKGRVLKLLLSLLKIACQHYGKLRSLGTESALRENDLPESAVANLFTSSKNDGGDFQKHYHATKLLMNLRPDVQIQKTALEVQNLLVLGRKREALQHAEEGQLWAFALVLSCELGEQFYADTIKRMAFSQLVAGTPLRTLCLLIAEKPEDVFSSNIAGGVASPGSVHMSPRSVRFTGCNMLDNWEENLAVITANRTENDHLVITHLGDSLWKERNDITAAHICYLIAEADFEPFSESARLCLIGGDHLNFPRTYASPEAIQRTELFEYSKVIGNSQFVLLSFQPYKLVYAYMLAEFGKVSDVLKYCQALHKSLKTGRSSEIDALKQQVTSLEDRIRTHQQGGYSVSLAPSRIMGKLFNLFDSTTHRVVGGLPPPVPSSKQNSPQTYEQHQNVAPKVLSSQSTAAMSSLVPSASMEPISQWALDSNRMTMQNRSVSEPDIGRTPRLDHIDSSNHKSATTTESKAPVSTRLSRFARFNFGAQILEKAVGLVLRPRHQAKLGEANKFYYDEKLKTWVEEGAVTPAGAAAPPPPPTTASFQSSTADNISSTASTDGLPAPDSSPDFSSSSPSESSAGFPSIPPSTNQFSARGRLGVRARYVDTFNKGGGSPANLFQTPSGSLIKPVNATAPKVFIPSAAAVSDEKASEAISESSALESFESAKVPSVSMNETFQKLPSSSVTKPRFSSFDSIHTRETKSNAYDSLPSLSSRRVASWGGSNSSTFSPLETDRFHHLGRSMGTSPLSSMASNSSENLQVSREGVGDDLQEVEL